MKPMTLVELLFWMDQLLQLTETKTAGEVIRAIDSKVVARAKAGIKVAIEEQKILRKCYEKQPGG